MFPVWPALEAPIVKLLTYRSSFTVLFLRRRRIWVRTRAGGSSDPRPDKLFRLRSSFGKREGGGPPNIAVSADASLVNCWILAARRVGPPGERSCQISRSINRRFGKTCCKYSVRVFILGAKSGSQAVAHSPIV